MQNSDNKIIKQIISHAIQKDSWLCQIQQLSLPKLSKFIMMNSWKKMINTDEIQLNLRSNSYYLYSQILHRSIHMELIRNIGKPIKLYFVKNDDFFKQTPIEYLYTMYNDQILKIKKKLLNDPNIIMIKSFFDIQIEDSEIKLI